MAKGFTIKFKRGIRSQVSATHLLEALSGKPQSPTCQVCGGVTTDNGPAAARCTCNHIPDKATTERKDA